MNQIERSKTGNDPEVRAAYLREAVDVAKGLGVSVSEVIAADALLVEVRRLNLELQRQNRESRQGAR